MNTSTLFAKTFASAFAMLGWMGFNAGTKPAVEPGFGLPSQPCGPWHSAQYLPNRPRPLFRSPASAAAGPGLPPPEGFTAGEAAAGVGFGAGGSVGSAGAPCSVCKYASTLLMS